MQQTKLISSKSAIERFLISTGSQSEINEDEIKMSIAEVVELIGTSTTFITKVTGHKQDTRYDFTDWQVPLPCDFFKLKPGGISVNGQAVRWSQNSFHYLMDGDCCDLPALNASPLDEFTDSFGNVFSPQEGFSGSNVFGDVTFSIQDNIITFNIKEGKVCLAYYAYPFDNEGYLMIPDTVKFKRAVSDYIRYKTDYILWRQGVINNDIFRYSEKEKEWSLAAAKNEQNMPDDYQMSSIQRSIVRLLPIQESINQFYGNLGRQETRTH